MFRKISQMSGPIRPHLTKFNTCLGLVLGYSVIFHDSVTNIYTLMTSPLAVRCPKFDRAEVAEK